MDGDPTLTNPNQISDQIVVENEGKFVVVERVCVPKGYLKISHQNNKTKSTRGGSRDA